VADEILRKPLAPTPPSVTPSAPQVLVGSVDWQVVVNRMESTPEAVEYARQAIAIPAEERTKQAQETTRQAQQLTIRSAIGVIGGSIAAYLAPDDGARSAILIGVSVVAVVGAIAWLVDRHLQRKSQTEK